MTGKPADPEALAAANLPAARRLFVTIPQAFEAGQVVQQARATSPALEIVARAHTDDEVEHLTRLGADLTVMGEREIAHRMIERGLRDDAPNREYAAAKLQERSRRFAPRRADRNRCRNATALIVHRHPRSHCSIGHQPRKARCTLEEPVRPFRCGSRNGSFVPSNGIRRSSLWTHLSARRTHGEVSR